MKPLLDFLPTWERTRTKTIYIYTLLGETWTFIHRPSAIIQVKCHGSTEEGETAGDLRKGFGRGKWHRPWHISTEVEVRWKLIWGVAQWKLERVLHVHQLESPSQGTGEEHLEWEEKRVDSYASVKPGWRGSVAHKKVHSFGDKETMVEVLGLNSQKITRRNSCGSVPPPVHLWNLSGALTEAHAGTNGLRGFILSAPINDSLHMGTLRKQKRKTLTWLFL